MNLDYDEICQEYVEMMFDKIEEGYNPTEEERKYLLDSLYIYTKEAIKIDKNSLRVFKHKANLFSTVFASMRLGGEGYRKDYLRIRKGMKDTIDHNKKLLEGIRITSNNMTDENLNILVEQRKLKVVHDTCFCKFMKQIKFNLESDDPDFVNQKGKTYARQMDQAREKILKLSYQYQPRNN